MAEFSSFQQPEGGNGQPPAQGYRLARKSSTGQFYIDYKLADDLRRFMTPNGKIQGRKKSGLTAMEQRMVSQAIKRARYMALLPYTSATL